MLNSNVATLQRYQAVRGSYANVVILFYGDATTTSTRLSHDQSCSFELLQSQFVSIVAVAKQNSGHTRCVWVA